MEWQSRTELLIGKENLGILAQSHVLVVGLGGVGAYAAEMIVRAGVGKVTIVDSDTVSESNINRQLIALHSTIGQSKPDLLAERLKDINPQAEITVIEQYIEEDSVANLINGTKYDYVVDAIDTLTPKVALIKATMDKKIPLVSSMGAGAKFDPTQVKIADIGKTYQCPLAYVLRKRLRKVDIHTGFWAVYSTELPLREAIVECEGRNKKSNTGTISYLPAVFGCTAASVVIRDLIGQL